VELLTVGHGTLVRDELARLLRGADVQELVDVRTAPGSRHNPDVARGAMERWVPDSGIGYRWEPRLGGWRKTRADSPNVALRNASFRGYADYMASEEFSDALGVLLEDATGRRSAIMCSEAVYWRCHRRLVADNVVLVHGGTVQHLGHDGRLSVHRPTDGVRVEDGLLVYDGDAPPTRLPGV
jgi:uncharacterized protein (DUF488 family)